MRPCLLALCSFLFFAANAQQVTIPASIYDFKVAAQNGGMIDLAQYRGKKIMIVNTPSEAFYNPRYAELESFYKQYKDKVVIIAFLDDDFGPAPGDSKATPVANKNYNVSFPLAAKIFVKSDKMAPIYHWLTEMKYNGFKDTEVKWDFQKYLISEEGKLIAVFDPKVKANSPQVIAAIEK
jgi:glutathione peroxidase